MIWAGAMAFTKNKQFLHYPKDHGAFGPFVPALSTPLCDCGLLAFVSQSRHPELARRAFYVCQLKRPPDLIHIYRDATSLGGLMAMRCLIR